MLPDVLQQVLNIPKDSRPRDRSDKANLDQGSDVKASVSAVSALGMPCTYFLQKMVLLFLFFISFLTLSGFPHHAVPGHLLWSKRSPWPQAFPSGHASR